jgi:hypothetical protein
VEGRVAEALPARVNRLLCYCADCQACLHHLGRGDLLDPQGGSDIVQIAPSSLTLVRGAERIRGLRLTPNGLYRWYAGCCQTPFGNTVGPAIPFVGLLAHTFEAGGGKADELFGAPRSSIFAKFAVGGPAAATIPTHVPSLVRSFFLIIGWRLSGKAWPHPYFDRATGQPIPPVTVLTPESRDALRPFCGPNPTARG